MWKAFHRVFKSLLPQNDAWQGKTTLTFILTYITNTMNIFTILIPVWVTIGLKHCVLYYQEKPHKCTLCSKSFPTPGDLRSHMYVHNGSWPFKCEICHRGFSKQTNLKNHVLLHSGKFICRIQWPGTSLSESFHGSIYSVVSWSLTFPLMFRMVSVSDEIGHS